MPEQFGVAQSAAQYGAEPYRVIVVEDDPDVAMLTKTVLEKRGLCIVLTIADPFLARSAVAEFAPDVIITDIELPGMSGLELIGLVREVRPSIPAIVMTAHASVDYAVTALRKGANEFLTKPVSSSDLIAHVTRLADAARAAAATAPQAQRVLAIGAHPHDVELGVGGILAAHRAAGDSVTILTLSHGDTASGVRDALQESETAAAVIGAQVMVEDTKSAAPGTDTVDAIKKAINEIKPTVVYVHSMNDSDLDHRAVHHAALVTTGAVRTVACYEGSGANVGFKPNRFVSIDGFTDKKLSMLSCFAGHGEKPDYLTADSALANARSWGQFGTGSYCEPLEILRESVEIYRA